MTRVIDFEFDEDRARTFAKLPRRIYAGDERWIPRDPAGEQALLSRENPFFSHGRARCFLALDAAGDPIGRCAAIVDERLAHEGRPVGQVGFFECVDDDEVARAVLDPAVAWLAAEGRSLVWGPMEFSIFHTYRFMTRGFDRTPFLGEPYNPPCYPELFTRYGFRPKARYFSWDLTGQHLALMGQMAGFARKAFEPQALADGYRFRTLDLSRFDEELAGFFALMAESFTRNLGHVPLTFEEFAFSRAGARDQLDPELILIAEAPDGSRAGASYVYPDHVPGRLVLHTMFARKEHRKRGLVEIGFGILSETIARKGFDSAIGALAREGPTFYDKTGPASREYTLYALGGEE